MEGIYGGVFASRKGKAEFFEAMERSVSTPIALSTG
jgi:hypothetical protein